MNLNRHLDDEEIEQYSLRSTPESNLACVEEHLLVCAQCRLRVEKCDEYIRSMRAAGRELRKSPARKLSLALLVIPVAAVVIAIIAAGLFPLHTGEKMPLAVTLSALRGAAGEAKAPAGQILELRPDLTGLAEGLAYRLEVVDEAGKLIAGNVDVNMFPQTRIQPLSPGTYFVRLYSRGDELLREYGLQVEARK